MTELHCNGERSAKKSPTRTRIGTSESSDQGRQILISQNFILCFDSEKSRKCTKQLVFATDAFSNHKSNPHCAANVLQSDLILF